jgi:ATP-dependent exoDNAse (exonuclease V) beta subunit
MFRQSEITLRESDHKYIVKTHKNLKFTSVTTFLHDYFTPFNSEKVASDLAGTGKHMNKSKQDLIKDWDNLRDEGTLVHKILEDYADGVDITPYKPLHPKAQHGIEWFENNRIREDFDVYTEVRLFSEELQLAGTVDLLLQHRKEKTWHLVDYKTNKAIRKSSMDGSIGTKPATILLKDCNYEHYTLQLSVYQYMLERYYGIKVASRTLLHLRPSKTRVYPEGYIPMPLDYYYAEVCSMISDRINLKRQGKLHEVQLFT